MTRTQLNGQQLLPAAPLAEWLSKQPDTDGTIARLVGVDAAMVKRLRKGEQRQVTLDTADRLLTLYSGCPDLLNDLYPLNGDA